ncbi:hypothetical protein BS50DRAFT_89149 [Corynespora cassiicola Philippines]|uniref:Uncharacterized protein n=1 Tax=Corynespora cassiicola Philippines TaxID=1448308 RepID=A0A2T2NEF2_CORCC|nr:hypothetical protein BS50DRAFT_89149 [Corynespora cassiicola Philippines]
MHRRSSIRSGLEERPRSKQEVGDVAMEGQKQNEGLTKGDVWWMDEAQCLGRPRVHTGSSLLAFNPPGIVPSVLCRRAHILFVRRWDESQDRLFVRVMVEFCGRCIQGTPLVVLRTYLSMMQFCQQVAATINPLAYKRTFFYLNRVTRLP